MPRGPGWLYRAVAMEAAAAAWRIARAEAERAPSLKELYLYVGRTGVAVKVAERRHPVPPRLLRRYAAMLLRHAKEKMRRPRLVLVAAKLTLGAARLAQRLNWIRIVPATLAKNPAKMAAIIATEELLALKARRTVNAPRQERHGKEHTRRHDKMRTWQPPPAKTLQEERKLRCGGHVPLSGEKELLESKMLLPRPES